MASRKGEANSMRSDKSSDPWSTVIIAVTIVLFILALFIKGFTHELLLEAAVFLVSLKLIQMARKNSETEGRLEQRLIEIQEALARTASYGASDRA